MSDEPSLAASFFGTLVRPAATFRALGEQKSASPGASAIALLGIFWSVLCAVLYMHGEQPSFVLLPIARDLYYMVQALLMTPVLTALFWIHTEIAHRICAAAKGKGTEPGVRSALGFAYAAPMLFFHVIPELAAYTSAGFETMALVGRFTLPISALAVWAFSTAALRIVHGVSIPIASLAALVGLVVQALAGSLFIR
jgi:hypothetical protein